MNTIIKNKLLSSLIVLLLLANMIAMGFFWWQHFKADSDAIVRKEGQGASAFLIDKLKFDSSQLVAYKELLAKHQDNIKLIKDSIHLAKDAFFDLLEKDTVTEQELQTGTSLAAEQQIKLDRMTFDFFKSVQTICTPQQKIIFKDIIREALRIMGRPTPPPGMRHPAEGQHHTENGPPEREDPRPTERGIPNEGPSTHDLSGAGTHTNQPPPRMEDRMKMVMDKINRELKLNGNEKEKIKEAYTVFFKEMEKMHQSGRPDEMGPPDAPRGEDREARMALAKIRDQKIQAILTPEQFKQYQELEKTMRPPQRPERRPDDLQE